MIRQEICEALYALPNGVVEPRRRSVLKPIVVTLIGFAIIALDLLCIRSENDALTMLLIVTGGSLALCGLLVAVMRIASDEQVPYHTPSKSYMNCRERHYTHDKLTELQTAVAMHDTDRIESIKTSNISSITLAECSTHDGSIVALAIYEYENYEDRLVGRVKLYCKEP